MMASSQVSGKRAWRFLFHGRARRSTKSRNKGICEILIVAVLLNDARASAHSTLRLSSINGHRRDLPRRIAGDH